MKQKLQEYLQKIKKKLQDSLQIIRQKLQDSLPKIKQWLGNQKLKSMPRFSPKLAAGIGIFLAVFVAVLWFFVHFSVHEVIVLGNIHYTKEEITDTVQRGLFGNNTLIVSRTHKSFSPDTLDLVDEIEVEMKDEHTLQITVQERQLIGYVQYLDCNLYFDSEGRVMNSVVRVEKDEEEQQVLTAEAVGKTATSYVAAMKEAPEICGLDFPWARLHEVLPIEDTSVFNTILGISRMINKYSIFPDTVEFDEEMNISLLYGEITVNLGTDHEHRNASPNEEISVTKADTTEKVADSASGQNPERENREEEDKTNPLPEHPKMEDKAEKPEAVKQGTFYPIETDMVFEHLDQVERGILVNQDGKTGILLPEEAESTVQSSSESPTGQWSEPSTSA